MTDVKNLNLSIHIFSRFSPSNPNVGGDNDGESDDESEWFEFKVPGLVVKDFKPGLQDLQGLQADHCKMWNDFVPSLVTYSGKEVHQYSKGIALRVGSSCKTEESHP